MNEIQSALLDQQLAESFLFAPYLGANVAIYSDRWGNWQGACGYCDPQTQTPIPKDERFYLYSITKTFTAVVILKLVETGQISLDDPVYPLISEIQLSNVITLRQLLNHTSGLFNYTEARSCEESLMAKPGEPWSEDEMINLIENRELDFEPGQGWHYSNTGYFVLKKIIESVCQKSYKDAIQSFITEPLQLTQTTVADDIPEMLTPGFSRDLDPNKRITRVSDRFHPGWCHTGLIVSTAQETAWFYHQLFAGDLLPPRLLQELCKPTAITPKVPRFGNSCYGLGVMVDTQSSYGEMYGHGGDGPGYNPWVMHLPDFQGTPLTLSILTNFNAGVIPLLLISDLLSQVATF